MFAAVALILLKTNLQFNLSPFLGVKVIAREVAVTEPVWVPVSVDAAEDAVAGKLALQLPFNVDLVFDEAFSVNVKLMVPAPCWLS